MGDEQLSLFPDEYGYKKPVPQLYGVVTPLGFVQLTEEDIQTLLRKLPDDVVKRLLYTLMKRDLVVDRPSFVEREMMIKVDQFVDQIKAQSKKIEEYRSEVMSLTSRLNRAAVARENAVEYLKEMEEVLSNEYAIEPGSTEAVWLTKVRPFIERNNR